MFPVLHIVSIVFSFDHTEMEIYVMPFFIHVCLQIEVIISKILFKYYIRHLLHAVHLLKVVCDMHFLTKLSVILIQECCICISSYEDGVEIRELPCGHHFHCACIDRWLHMNSTCPLCKLNISKGHSVGNENV